MKNPCGKFAPDDTRSPIGKGQKTKEKVRGIFGSSGSAKKFITGK